ncbi:hypothetical protein PMAYCL1PPCAC_22483, partial [Pristionchus mayeri]
RGATSLLRQEDDSRRCCRSLQTNLSCIPRGDDRVRQYERSGNSLCGLHLHHSASISQSPLSTTLLQRVFLLGGRWIWALGRR